MGKAVKRIKIEGEAGSLEVDALFDTGSTRCHITKEIADKISPTSTGRKREVGTAMGEELKDEYRMSIVVDDCGGAGTVFIWDELPKDEDDPEGNDVIIGHKIMQDIGIVEIELDEKPTIMCKPIKNIFRGLK